MRQSLFPVGSLIHYTVRGKAINDFPGHNQYRPEELKSVIIVQ